MARFWHRECLLFLRYDDDDGAYDDQPSIGSLWALQNVIPKNYLIDYYLPTHRHHHFAIITIYFFRMVSSWSGQLLVKGNTVCLIEYREVVGMSEQ